jgi:hypothetical protein
MQSSDIQSIFCLNISLPLSGLKLADVNRGLWCVPSNCQWTFPRLKKKVKLFS